MLPTSTSRVGGYETPVVSIRGSQNLHSLAEFSLNFRLIHILQTVCISKNTRVHGINLLESSDVR